jgi:hypothetical protein
MAKKIASKPSLNDPGYMRDHPVDALIAISNLSWPRDLPAVINAVDWVDMSDTLPAVNRHHSVETTHLAPRVPPGVFREFLDREFPVNEFSDFRSFLKGWAYSEVEMYESVRQVRELMRSLAGGPVVRVLTLTEFPLHELLRGIDVSRIRLCEKCRAVFYAYRNNTLTCSIRCGNALRTQKWRERSKIYNKARRNARKGVKR